MKKRIVAVLLTIALVLGLGVTAIASTGEVDLTVTFRDIVVTRNGEEVALKDEQGATVEPFLYKGTTYLPIRAISEAIGYEVSWDGSTSTVILDTPEEEPTDNAVVKTTEGWYIGTKELGVYTFKGMQYGVAERFKSATRPNPFPGLHAATVYGNSCPTSAQSGYGSTINVTNYMTPNANFTEDEDCLYINVWSTSLEPTAEMPVLFWIHGGGFSSGASNELTYYDGLEFAKSQDVVFVSINHRLNVLGYTDLSAYGEEYKNSGNLGQEDIVLALEWVRDNIAAFGGDPDNVTIMGQSGGGSKVTSLLSCAPAQGLFHKAAIFSGGGAISNTSEKTQAAGVKLVEKAKETYGLATDEEALAKLGEIDYAELLALTSGTGVGGGPTIDGEFIVESPIDPETGYWTEMCKDIPMMISTVYAEMAGAIDDNTIPALINNTTDYNPTMHGVAQEKWPTLHNKAHMTEEYKDSELTRLYGDKKDAILAAFAKAYPELEAYDITRMNKRSNSMAIGRAESCTAPTYQVVYAYEFPAFGGQMAWHTGGDIPFVFNNMKYVENLIAGDSVNAQKLADLASTGMGNFCKYGDPSTAELEWPAFTVENGETMIYNNTNSEIRYYHDAEVVELLNSLPSSGGGFPF